MQNIHIFITLLIGCINFHIFFVLKSWAHLASSQPPEALDSCLPLFPSELHRNKG